MLVLVLNRADAAFPGNNGQLAFTSFWANFYAGEYYTQEIHVKYPDGGATNLTPDSGEFFDGQPAWSPDGKKIAFATGGYTIDSSEIYVMNADGTERNNLSKTPVGDGDPAWSPDGKKIAFATGSEIHVMNAADGSEQTNLGVGSDPAWSPDGSKIAFEFYDGNSDIYVMNADGTERTNLTNNPGRDTDPSWSPDGSKIAFTTNRDSGNNEIYVMDADDGSGQTNLTMDSHSDVGPAWSPDGTKIAFATDRQSSYTDSGNSEVFLMSATDGSGQTNVTNTDDRAESEPDWQPRPGSDVFPPETEITSVETSANTAKFGLGSSESGSTFECRLDTAPFQPCQSPASYDGLTLGEHTFEVRARDAASNPDPTPAKHTWSVSDVLPETWIGDVIWGCNGKPNCYAFWFRSSQSDSTFECRLSPVEATFTACWPPAVYYVTSSGAYTFEVRAKDAKGRVDPSPDTETFSYTAPTDTTAPETTITSGPSGMIADDTPTFEFSASEAGSFACRIDTAAFAPCTSPYTPQALPLGPHTFEVRATDTAGNVDASPATSSFTVVPSLSIGDGSVTEGNRGTKSLSFTVTLAKASNQAISVAWSTANGTATAVEDYTAASGTLTFAPGEVTKTITVLVKGDRKKESNETFFVNLSTPTNAIIADGQGVGTIVNND